MFCAFHVVLRVVFCMLSGVVVMRVVCVADVGLCVCCCVCLPCVSW